MSDGTNPQSNPQPEPAPGSGGYGFPPGPPAQGGYGFPPGPPPAQSGYGFPPGPPAQEGGGYGYPQAGPPNPYQPDAHQPDPYRQDAGAQQAPWSPGQPGIPGQGPGPGGDQPDWEAMADRSAAERRKKRLWMLGGGVTVLALLAGGGTFFLLGGEEDPEVPTDDPAVSASASPGGPSGSAAPYSPTVEGDATLLRDSNGKIGIRLGSGTQIAPVGKRFQIVSKGTSKSYAQASEAAVDVTKSFSVTARLYNSAAKGSRIAVSQGDGESFSFELGIDQVNGKQAWIFRVQTGDKGAAATTQTVVAEGLNMVKTPTTVIGAYDAEKKTIALYVDGKKAGEAAVPGIWQAPGPLQLGRSRHHGIWSSAWQGGMHNIRIYETAFSPELAAAYKEGKMPAATKPSHSWLLS
ncbi:LamG-like jellyroll fold domain-containing protein [Streptomyces sp. NPDC058525]|uniref:LamG-like jellyroll fold domain-containing protein n=1 Tax=Streptomyces sp. NPDC058525 TaxID=3346538 RepID=UPI003654F0E4